MPHLALLLYLFTVLFLRFYLSKLTHLNKRIFVSIVFSTIFAVSYPIIIPLMSIYLELNLYRRQVRRRIRRARSPFLPQPIRKVISDKSKKLEEEMMYHQTSLKEVMIPTA